MHVTLIKILTVDDIGGNIVYLLWSPAINHRRIVTKLSKEEMSRSLITRGDRRK